MRGAPIASRVFRDYLIIDDYFQQAHFERHFGLSWNDFAAADFKYRLILMMMALSRLPRISVTTKAQLPDEGCIRRKFKDTAHSFR